MLKSEPYYWVVCDGCGERCEYDDYSAWGDDGTAVDMAIDSGWLTRDNVHYCEECGWSKATWCQECEQDYDETRKRDAEEYSMCEECARS